MAVLGKCYRVDDPRDALGKATRWQLYQWALANKVTEVVHEMPAALMRDILRGKGLTRININPRPLGPDPDAKIVEVNASADLLRQWQDQQKRVAEPRKPVPPQAKRLVERPRSEINQLRDKCKALGIKMERKDNLVTLKAKIAAHG